MTLLWMDGFEGFTAGGNRTVLDPVYDYDGFTSTSEAGVFATSHGEKAAFMAQAALGIASTHHLSVTSPTSDTTWIVGTAFRVAYNLVLAKSESYAIQFLDSAGDPMVTIRVTGGNLSARSGGAGGTKLGFASARLVTRVWDYLECKVTFNASSGSITARINEEEVLNVSGVNTAPTISGETSPSEVRFGGPSIDHMRTDVDDFYICDAAGSTNNDFLGDVGIKRIKASGNGTTSDFTGSDGNSVDNYQHVDDDDPDDDTSYSGSSTVGHKDLYVAENLPSTPAAINAVSLVTYGRKTDSGSRTFVHVARSGTTESDSSALSPAETYGHQYSIYETDPDTSAAWTESGVNGLEIGVKVAS